MIDFLRTLPPAALVGIIIGFAFVFKMLGEAVAFFFKDYWGERKLQAEKRDSALANNTLAILKLEMKLDQFTEALSLIPKMKADIDFAHLKIREIQNGSK